MNASNQTRPWVQPVGGTPSMKLLPVLPVPSVWSVLAACMACTAPAMGHALAVRTSPGAGAMLAQPPASVSVYFDARLEPLFSKLTVTDAGGAKISADGGEVAPGSPNALTARLSGAAKGVCHVHWDVVSRDGHRSRGDYTFTVK